MGERGHAPRLARGWGVGNLLAEAKASSEEWERFEALKDEGWD